MFHHFSAANFAIVKASWPVFGVWSVKRGPARPDTSEICSPEATVVQSCGPPKSGILCARRGAQTRLHGFSLALHCILTPLSGAAARALLATPSFSRLRWLRYAPVRRSATAISSRIALTVSLCCLRRRALSCDEHQDDQRPCHAAAPLSKDVMRCPWKAPRWLTHDLPAEWTSAQLLALPRCGRF